MSEKIIENFCVEGHKFWSFTVQSKEIDVHTKDPDQFRTALGAIAPVHHLIVGREFGKKKKTPHWQCTVAFSEPVTFAALHDFKFDDHFVLAKLKHHEAKTKKWYNAQQYCRKDGNQVEFGTADTKGYSPGSSMMDCIMRAQAGESIRSIVLSHPVYMAYNLERVQRAKRMFKYIRENPDDHDVEGFFEQEYKRQRRYDNV